MSISRKELKRAKAKALLRGDLKCASCKHLKWADRSDRGYPPICVCEYNKTEYHSLSDVTAVWCKMWNDVYNNPDPGVTYL